MSRVLIFGATSAIAIATARILCVNAKDICLVARNADRLQAVADDLAVRGPARIHCAVADLADLSCHEQIILDAEVKMGGMDTVLVAYGSLPDQAACESRPEQGAAELQNNFVSVAVLLLHVAARLEKRRHGAIAVITSVAGDRGRRSNYVYGSAKGGLSIFLSGLRARLQSAGVSVTTIKPGFVDTPMTAHLKKGLLFASPDNIAHGIVAALKAGRREVYLPWFWRWIMLVIKLLPESIFSKLKL